MTQLEDRVLQLLEQDCTIPRHVMAARCGVEEADIDETIARLEAEDVILGYQALVNWEKTKKETVTALIEVKVTPQRDKGFDRIADRIYQFDEVESVYLMSGSFDLTVIISGRTLKEVATFVSERLSVIEGVTGTATHFILKKYKEKHALFTRQEEQTDRIAFV